jgi:hypothetical protein
MDAYVRRLGANLTSRRAIVARSQTIFFPLRAIYLGRSKLRFSPVLSNIFPRSLSAKAAFTNTNTSTDAGNALFDTLHGVTPPRR